MQATVTSKLAGLLGTIAGAASETSDVLVPWAGAGRNRQNPGARDLRSGSLGAVFAGVRQWPQRLQRPGAVEE